MSLCPAVLSIAGSDSGGGAGIQADLKTISALGGFATTALTCITAQTPDAVSGIVALDPAMVTLQIKAVCEGFPVAAAKTGMLYSAEIIHAVAAADVQEGIPVLVVDPVMVAASGARLLRDDAVAALCEALIPHARVITPNLHEAEILCGHPIETVEQLTRAAREIGERFDVACVAKGGYLSGLEVVDVLYDAGEEFQFSGPRILCPSTHGAGCAFSAALTTFLARGELLANAVSQAKHFVAEALRTTETVGRHHPLKFFHGCGAAAS